MSNENLHKEHINFIAGVRNKKSRLRSCRLGSTDLGEIAESAASSVINLKKARQKLRSNQRLFETVSGGLINGVGGDGVGGDGGDGELITSGAATTMTTVKTVRDNNTKTSTGAAHTATISIIDGSTSGGGSGGDLPKIKMMPAHSFMSPHDEELLSSIATATSCSQKKFKMNGRMPLNIPNDEQSTTNSNNNNNNNRQQSTSLPPLPPHPTNNGHQTTTNQKNLADNSSLTNLTIETNDLSLGNEVGGGVGIARRGSFSSGKPPRSTPIAFAEQQNNSIHNNQVAAQSPNFIRDRYYQILREQVFPFLQKPSNNLNINQSPKEVQNYCNDVLY